MDGGLALEVQLLSTDTLAAGLEVACTRFGDRPALVWSDGVMTYKGLHAAVSALVGAYRRLGVATGDRVVCQLPNRPEFLVSAAAAWAHAAIHVGADKDLTPAELAWLVDRTDAAALVTQAGTPGVDRSAAIRPIHEQRPTMPIIVCGEVPGVKDGCLAFSELVSSTGTSETVHGAPAPGPAPNDPAVLLFTSGTTGAPKGVVRHHGQLLGVWSGMSKALGASEGDAHLVQLPLSHGFGFGLAVAGLLSGGRLVLVERFSPEEALALIAQEQISVLHGSPAHFRLLVDRLDLTRHDVSSLRIGVGSGASFAPDLLPRIFDDLGMDLILAYGSSEGLGCSTNNREDILRGSVGRPSPDSVRIVGPDRMPLAAGEVGEIALRRSHALRYWGEPETTTAAAAAPDQWYFTGDVGRIDAEGCLYVLGRVKHQVNRGGIRVDPGEVEAALASYPGLADAAVVATPDPVLGELVCACVVPAEGEGEPTLHEVRSVLATSLAKHKLPEELCVLERIPRTALGKVDRKALQAMAVGAEWRQRLRER